MSQLLTQLFSETQPLNCCCCYGAVSFLSNIGISLAERPKERLVFERPAFLCCLHIVLQSVFVLPTNEICEGYVFTPVCHSVHGGGCLPQCMLGYTPLGRPPRSRHPPAADTLLAADTSK